MRKPIIAANWKMHKTPQETQEFLRDFLPLMHGRGAVDVVIAPPFVSLAAAQAVLTDRDHVRLAGQNMYFEVTGAFTGEISPMMLRSMFISYVILGHSERRSLFGETDEIINKKVVAAHVYHLKPILCIGETLSERDAGKVESVLRTQLEGCLKGLDARQVTETVLAYEPVWAIGTGRTASSQQAQDAHAFIRETIKNLYDVETARKVRIQYGGSVKPGNAAELLSMEDVDGFLVGGASLESGSFYEIVKAGMEKAGEE